MMNGRITLESRTIFCVAPSPFPFPFPFPTLTNCDPKKGFIGLSFPILSPFIVPPLVAFTRANGPVPANLRVEGGPPAESGEGADS